MPTRQIESALKRLEKESFDDFISGIYRHTDNWKLLFENKKKLALSGGVLHVPISYEKTST